MSRRRVLRIGIRSYEDSKGDLRAFAQGARRPENDPRVWVSSAASMAQLLSNDNLRLLDLIKSTEPPSVTALARAAGREVSNVSRTLSTMASYGLVELIEGEGRQKTPRVKFDRLEIVYRPRVRQRQTAIA